MNEIGKASKLYLLGSRHYINIEVILACLSCSLSNFKFSWILLLKCKNILYLIYTHIYSSFLNLLPFWYHIDGASHEVLCERYLGIFVRVPEPSHVTIASHINPRRQDVARREKKGDDAEGYDMSFWHGRTTARRALDDVTIIKSNRKIFRVRERRNCAEGWT